MRGSLFLTVTIHEVPNPYANDAAASKDNNANFMKTKISEKLYDQILRYPIRQIHEI